jgi:hypothetical protein
MEPLAFAVVMRGTQSQINDAKDMLESIGIRIVYKRVSTCNLIVKVDQPELTPLEMEIIAKERQKQLTLDTPSRVSVEG